MPCVFAVAAHPDDIEFGMAGTLFLLRNAGWQIHYMNIANGSCGSATLGANEIAEVRTTEARAAAAQLEAVFHSPIVRDLEVYFEKHLVARMSSVVRDVAPDMMLVPSPQDYMEDHMNACRVAVAAAFCRGMRNHAVEPQRPPIMKPVTIYHAQPYGNRDGLNQLVTPEFFVNIESVLKDKRNMLAQHRSQKEWLDESQGVGSYLDAMEAQAAEIGELSGKFKYAEGWRRHNPLGLCDPDADPLRLAVGKLAHPPLG